jgi:prevent-host-death family protein
MATYNIHEAKTHFSKLIAKVEKGEEVIIAKAGKVVAKLVPAEAQRPKIRFGSLQGQAVIPDDFDETDPEIEALFYGSD